MSDGPRQEVTPATGVCALVWLTFDVLDDDETSGCQRADDVARRMETKVEVHGRTEEIVEMNDLVSDVKGDQSQRASRQWRMANGRMANAESRMSTHRSIDKAPGDNLNPPDAAGITPQDPHMPTRDCYSFGGAVRHVTRAKARDPVRRQSVTINFDVVHLDV